MGKKLLLTNIDVPGIRGLNAYRAQGGYAALEKALRVIEKQLGRQADRAGHESAAGHEGLLDT